MVAATEYLKSGLKDANSKCFAQDEAVQDMMIKLGVTTQYDVEKICSTQLASPEQQTRRSDR